MGYHVFLTVVLSQAGLLYFSYNQEFLNFLKNTSKICAQSYFPNPLIGNTILVRMAQSILLVKRHQSCQNVKLFKLRNHRKQVQGKLTDECKSKIGIEKQIV